MKNVFGNERARALLLQLEENNVPVRYSEVREQLGFSHPEDFQRALKPLQSYGLVQYKAPRVSDTPKNAVYLQVSPLGSLFAELWHELNDELAKLMEDRHIPASALKGLAAEG